MNKNIRTGLEGNDSRHESTHFLTRVVDAAPERNANNSGRETVETITKKQAGLIENKSTLKVLKHVERNNLMKEVHRLDKVLLPNVGSKTPLNDTIVECTFIVTENFNRAKCNGNQRANQQPG